MAPKPSKASKSVPRPPEVPKEYPTIAAQLEDEYLASRPYQVLKDTKGLSNLTPNEKTAYAYHRFLDTGAWRSWPVAQQKEFWKTVEQLKIPTPLPKPKDLGKDSKGKDIGSYTPDEYKAYQKKERDLSALKDKSERFRKRHNLRQDRDEDDSAEIEEERNRRKLIGVLQGKRMGQYEGNPRWDDVIPIPQNDGEGALAAIAYTDEYSEAMGYLRAIMAAKEYSPRVLELTEHIISMNPAHYTVWLYRASTLFALDSSISEEIRWVNEVALDNQKNYQIWHHRQLLVDHLYTKTHSDPVALKKLADSEVSFMNQMFDEDSKNYHVWSYRQYLVRKLNLWDQGEIQSIEVLLRNDVRNNSAWSHRFFVVFSNPSYSSPSSKATEHDPAIPAHIVDRELDFCKAAVFEAPQNLSSWNYLRGVLRKGGRTFKSQDWFAEQFAKIPEEKEDDVKSSHALDYLADMYTEEGVFDKADLALRLLSEKYDKIRKNYWEWRRGLLKEQQALKTEQATKGVGELKIGN